MTMEREIVSEGLGIVGLCVFLLALALAVMESITYIYQNFGTLHTLGALVGVGAVMMAAALVVRP